MVTESTKQSLSGNDNCLWPNSGHWLWNTLYRWNPCGIRCLQSRLPSLSQNHWL